MQFMRRNALGFVFEADKGANSGGDTSNGDGKNGSQKNAGDNANTEKKNGGDSGQGTPPASKSEKTFTQAELDSIIADRLKREQDKLEEAKKKTSGEFQALYEETRPKLEKVETEVTTLKAERDKLAEIVDKKIAEEIKDWPKEIKDLYDATLSYEKRLDWITKMTPVVKKLATTTTVVKGEEGKKGGNGAGTRPEQSYMNTRYNNPNIGGNTSKK